MNVYDKDEQFWETYIKGRPRVPESFFERIYSYHANKGGTFDRVHDAGAGPGVHSPRLAERFSHIIISDVSSENVEAARKRLQNDDRFSFQVAKIEDVASIDPASIDVFATFVAIHFTGDKIYEAMKEAARQLKPGGTFAAAAFGMAVFDNPDIQQRWLNLFQRSAEKLFGSRPEIFPIAAITSSAYDAVPLPTEYFAPDARRIKINFPEGWSWRSMQIAPKYQDDIPKVSRIGEQEEVSFETDPGWRFEWDSEDLTAHMTSFPTLVNQETGPLWQELLTLVGDRKITGSWPAVLILATRT